MNQIIKWAPIIGPMLAAIIAVLGWFVAHRLNVVKETATKRRELRVQYLIEAYRRLEGASHRSDARCRRELESAIADIQLFGSNRQVDRAHQFIESVAKDGFATYNPLLEQLRDELRRELNISQTTSEIKIFRFGGDEGGF